MTATSKVWPSCCAIGQAVARLSTVRSGPSLFARDDATGTGVAFDLLSSAEVRVVTGHDDGVITLDLAEADSEHREHLRLQ